MKLPSLLLLLASTALAHAASPWAGTYQGPFEDKSGQATLYAGTVKLAVFADGSLLIDNEIGGTVIFLGTGTIAPNGTFTLTTGEAHYPINGAIPLTGTIRKVGQTYLLRYTYTPQQSPFTVTGSLRKQL